MKSLEIAPKLVEQVHQALMDEIAGGSLKPGSRIVQEQLAKELGVSRQPIQQALALLKSQGVLVDAPGRGLLVTPLEPGHVRNMYDIRAVLEGLAFRLAAEKGSKQAKAKGQTLIKEGLKAVKSKSSKDLIEADMAFHRFIYELADNPLIQPAMENHWLNTRRIMGEVLGISDQPRNVWEQHQMMLDCIIAGEADKVEKMAREHILQSADYMIGKLEESQRAGASLA